MDFNIPVRGRDCNRNTLLKTIVERRLIRTKKLSYFICTSYKPSKNYRNGGVRGSAALKVNPISRIQYFRFRNNITKWGALDDKT